MEKSKVFLFKFIVCTRKLNDKSNATRTPLSCQSGVQCFDASMVYVYFVSLIPLYSVHRYRSLYEVALFFFSLILYFSVRFRITIVQVKSGVSLFVHLLLCLYEPRFMI